MFMCHWDYEYRHQMAHIYDGLNMAYIFNILNIGLNEQVKNKKKKILQLLAFCTAHLAMKCTLPLPRYIMLLALSHWIYPHGQKIGRDGWQDDDACIDLLPDPYIWLCGKTCSTTKVGSDIVALL